MVDKYQLSKFERTITKLLNEVGIEVKSINFETEGSYLTNEVIIRGYTIVNKKALE